MKNIVGYIVAVLMIFGCAQDFSEYDYKSNDYISDLKVALKETAANLTKYAMVGGVGAAVFIGEWAWCYYD